MERAFAAAWDHVVLEDPVASADAIFCFGSRHWRVPERAAALYHQGVAPLVLVTGGPSAPGETTEAVRFGADLVDRGVPADRIVFEHVARHTGENVTLGLEALRSRRGARADRLVLVSWPLATRRCRATFQRLAPEVEVASAPALPRPGVRWVPTQRRVRFLLGELDRLDRYAREGHIVAQPEPAGLRAAVAVLRRALDAGHLPDASFDPVEELGTAAVEAEDVTLLVGQA